MEQLRKISKEQIMMAFVATCIEATARLTDTNYIDVYNRMKNVGLIENYIIPNYETLHTESREILVNRLLECLNSWESKL